MSPKLYVEVARPISRLLGESYEGLDLALFPSIFRIAAVTSPCLAVLFSNRMFSRVLVGM